MVVGGRAASVLPLNLPHLQNLIKRDSDSYRTEFFLQQTHFYSTLGLMQASGWENAAALAGTDGSDEDGLENLITFMSHCVPCYTDKKGSSSELSDAEKFVNCLMDLLERDAASLPPLLRRCMCQALILMRSKKGVSLVPTERMLKLFFRLFGLKDKPLRNLLYDAIVADVRKANHPHRNNALNRTLQNFMYSIFSTSATTGSNNINNNVNNSLNSVTSTSDEMTATKSLQVIIELYRRSIWNDAKTVNIIAEAALKGNCPKAMVMALNFFLGKYPGAAEVGADDENEDGNSANPDSKSIASSEEYRMLLHACQVGGVSKAKKNRLKRILSSDRKRAKSSLEGGTSGPSSFSPLSQVNDPQGFAERLYRLLKGSSAAFEVKLLMMNVLSRFISWHKLLVLDFYSFLLRYLQPHQRQVTQVLAYAAQATHALIPPDTLYPVLRAIADNFVSEGAAEAVIAAGLNGVREICTRAPLAMTETLLQDLTGYKKGGDHKNKGVMMAARSLITLFRELNPDMLHRRDRGRDVSMAMSSGSQKKSLSYGEVETYNASKPEKAVEVEVEETETCEAEEESYECSESSDNVEGSCDDSEEESVNFVSDEGDEELIFEELSGSELEESDEEECEDSESDSECPELVENKPVVVVPAGKKGRKAKSSVDIVVPEPSANAKRVKFISSERILLPEDYEPKTVNKKPKKVFQLASDEESDSSESEQDSDENGEPSDFIDPSKIEGYRSRAKADYEARLASIHAGREGREKFGTRKRGNSRSSTTNKEKSKGKNYLMMAHKFEIKGKRRRALKVKQAVQKKHKSNMNRRH